MNDHLIISSRGELILFNLTPLNNIDYTIYDPHHNPLITKKLCGDRVLNFYATIDDKNVIHLISLMESGQLNYFIFKDDNWSKAVISKFNFKSNIYNNMLFFLEGNNINLFYDYANLINSKLWTIQHVVGDSNTWKKSNVINFIADKNTYSFHLDKDSFGTIHLLYSSNNKDGYQIYHTFYSSLAEKWNQPPYHVSNFSTNNIFPYLFVDSKDNLHGLWLEGKIDENTLKYFQFSSSSKEGYQWRQINIPYVSNCNHRPIMIEENGLLKIIYSHTNCISFLYSSDYGKSWFEGDTLDVNNAEIKLVKITGNLLNIRNTKINYAYCTTKNALQFYFIDAFNPLDNESSPTKPLNTNILSKQFLSNDHNKEIQLKDDDYSESQEEIKALLLEISNSQKTMEKDIQRIIKLLGEYKPSFLHKLFGSSK